VRKIRPGTWALAAATAVVGGLLIGYLDLDFAYALLALFGLIASVGVVALLVELPHYHQRQQEAQAGAAHHIGPV
jgi:hypothetical protein